MEGRDLVAFLLLSAASKHAYAGIRHRRGPGSYDLYDIFEIKLTLVSKQLVHRKAPS